MPLYDTRKGKYFAETASERDAWLLEEYRRDALAAWNATMSARLDSIVSDYPYAERYTWGVSEKEAREVKANPNARSPFIEAAAAASGLSKAALAQTIVDNADTFSVASGQLVGERIAGTEAIKAATTLAEMEAVRERLGV